MRALTTSPPFSTTPNTRTKDPENGSRARNLDPNLLLNDPLGKLVQQAKEEASLCPTLEDYLATIKSKGDLQPSVQDITHPAAQLLKTLQHQGASVIMNTPQWTATRKQETLNRGPHHSAVEHSEFVREEFVDMIRKQFWTVLPATTVLNHPDLRLSPLGVVPQNERRPRIICDYSFYGINDESNPTGPGEAMRFGRALRRIITRSPEQTQNLGQSYWESMTSQTDIIESH